MRALGAVLAIGGFVTLMIQWYLAGVHNPAIHVSVFWGLLSSWSIPVGLVLCGIGWKRGQRRRLQA
jgi:hypothetical protein